MDSGIEAGAAPPSCAEDCGEHQVCERVDAAPACVCSAGYDACDSGCVDLGSDPENCGQCGYQCEIGLGCKKGECEQKIRELVLGGNSSCALYDAPDGRYPVKCWGDTSHKLFRDAASEAVGPRSIVGVPAARHMAIDGNRQCIVLPDRDVVRCWGLCDARCGSNGTFGLSDTFFDNEVGAIADVFSTRWRPARIPGLVS